MKKVQKWSFADFLVLHMWISSTWVNIFANKSGHISLQNLYMEISSFSNFLGKRCWLILGGRSWSWGWGHLNRDPYGFATLLKATGAMWSRISSPLKMCLPGYPLLRLEQQRLQQHSSGHMWIWPYLITYISYVYYFSTHIDYILHQVLLISVMVNS